MRTNHRLPSLPTDCLFFFQFIFDCSGSSLLRSGCSLAVVCRLLIVVLLSLLSTPGYACISVAVAPGLQGSVVVAHRLSCPEACRIFLDQESTCVPCVGRQILYHWTTTVVTTTTNRSVTYSVLEAVYI